MYSICVRIIRKRKTPVKLVCRREPFAPVGSYMHVQGIGTQFQQATMKVLQYNNS